MTLSRKMLYVFGLFAFGAGLIVFSPPAVQAVENDDDTTKTEYSTTSSKNEEDEKEDGSRSRVRTDVVESVVTENRAKAEKEVANERKTRVKLDDETRIQLCKDRKDTIENKVRAYGGHADAYLDRLDGVYEKLDTYLLVKPIDSANMTSADAAQLTAAEKVFALKSIVGDAELDCSNLTDNATWLTEVRGAATEAKDALKAYKAELKKVVAAIGSAQQDAEETKSDNTSTETGDDTNADDAQRGV